MSWHLDVSKSFIELIDGDEKQIVDDKYQVEQGNYNFKINAKDFETAPIVIVTRSIECEIVNEKLF